MPITIYHNPKCATSRAVLKLLRDRGLEPEVIDYLKQPPGRPELAALLKLLGLEPRALLRTREPAYRKAKLDDPDTPDSAILAALVKYPRLLQRPIVVVNNRKAAIGRPPGNILRILGK